MFRSSLLVLVCLAVVVSGCRMMALPTPSAPTPRATVTPAGHPVTPTPVPAPTSPPGSPITLTVWLPDTLASSNTAQTMTVLSQQLAAFAAARSDVRVQTQIKRARGAGSLIELIQTAAVVAPSFLPDVALIELTDVSMAAQAGVLQSVGNSLPADALADLFPFAQVGRADGQWVAVAYATDMEHLAYNAMRVQSPPIMLSQVFSPSQTFLFPMGGSGGPTSDVLFTLYAAAGGDWVDASGQPALDATSLSLMLRSLKDAQQAGAISANVLNLVSADDTWQAYLNAPTQMAVVRASRFIPQHMSASLTTVASLPGPTGPARPIARGWALVVPTRDPAHLSLAAALVAWLISPENEGAWARAANLLPARRAAFDHWYPADAYTAFARQELDRAIAPPPAYVAQVVGPALQKAAADVLRGQAQPAEAAAAAATNVGRSPR